MIWQNTAWGEEEGVRRIIEEKRPSIKVYFQEEEPECGLFATNSFEHFPERYLLDSYDEPLYFEDIEEAAKCVSDIVGNPVEPNGEAINRALDDYLAEHEDNDTWHSCREFIEGRNWLLAIDAQHTPTQPYSIKNGTCRFLFILS